MLRKLRLDARDQLLAPTVACSRAERSATVGCSHRSSSARKTSTRAGQAGDDEAGHDGQSTPSMEPGKKPSKGSVQRESSHKQPRV